MKSKKLFLATIVLSLLALQANAQIFVTGDLSFKGHSSKEIESNVTTNGDPETRVALGVSGGTFLSENFAVGLGLSASSYVSKDASSSDKYSISTLYVSPFVKYYFYRNGNFALLAKGTVEAGFGTSKYTYSNVTTKGDKVTELIMMASPMIEYSLTENWALSCSFGSLYYKTMISKDRDSSDKEVENEYGLGLDLTSITFGVLYTF